MQPNDDFGCDMNELSDRAIDVYDNAMFIIALRELEQLTADKELIVKWSAIREGIAANVRKHRCPVLALRSILPIRKVCSVEA